MIEASKTQVMTFEELVTIWQLQPHPEGGWYREVQRSAIQIQRPDGVQRSAITAVLFLLRSDDLSRWHRVQGGDEIWTFISGSPLSLFRHPQDATTSEELELSNVNPLACVDAGVWMAARSHGDHSLVSCCVGPGFQFDDFEMLRDQPLAEHPCGIRADLL